MKRPLRYVRLNTLRDVLAGQRCWKRGLETWVGMGESWRACSPAGRRGAGFGRVVFAGTRSGLSEGHGPAGLDAWSPLP